MKNAIARKRTLTVIAATLLVVSGIGCNGVPVDGIIDDILNQNGNANDNANDNTNDNGATGNQPRVQLDAFATNTNHASGLALRPSDGALFTVNVDGLFGPLTAGVDVATLTSLGATNLGAEDIFDIAQEDLVLAITDAGEFWIGATCCATLAIVAAEGGDAVPFTALLEGVDPSNIKPETFALVPAGFDGDQIDPGNLLVGQETTFSRLSAIDVAGDRAVVNVDNPTLGTDQARNREAHHLAFGPDGTLYSSRGTTSALLAGVQTIAADGTPTDLPGTTGIAAHSFVVTDAGDLIIRGTQRLSGTSSRQGIFIWSAATQTIDLGLEMTSSDVSESDEMVRAADGTIFLSLPNRDEIVTVTLLP